MFTRMPTAARSRATGRVMPTTPPLDDEYAAWPIWPSNAATLAMLTIAPRSPRLGGLDAAHRRRGQPDAVEGADQVDREHLLVGVEVVRRGELAVLADGALRPADAGGVHQGAQRAEIDGRVDRVLDLRRCR